MGTETANQAIEILNSLERFDDPARRIRRSTLIASECIVDGWTSLEMKHLVFYRRFWRRQPVEAR
jgi:hypothetical protein